VLPHPAKQTRAASIGSRARPLNSVMVVFPNGEEPARFGEYLSANPPKSERVLGRLSGDPLVPQPCPLFLSAVLQLYIRADDLEPL
jgi:hypothetical protein